MIYNDVIIALYDNLIYFYIIIQYLMRLLNAIADDMARKVNIDTEYHYSIQTT